MALRYLHLSFVVMIVVLLRFIPEAIPARPRLHRDILAMTGNPEARLAAESQIRLSTASQGDLQLIPGVAGDLSVKIATMRDEIMKKAEKLPVDEKYRALEIVHGIGVKKAEQIGRYLNLD